MLYFEIREPDVRLSNQEVNCVKVKFYPFIISKSYPNYLLTILRCSKTLVVRIVVANRSHLFSASHQPSCCTC